MNKAVLGGMAAVIVVAAATAFLAWPDGAAPGRADPTDIKQVALGRQIYAKQCASCHGTDMAGEPDWQSRKPTGALPAPPHDETGHTWHHPDAQLFAITKQGVKPFAPAGYISDMPGFGDRLSDAEIWATLAYIKSRWSPEVQAKQEVRNQTSGG